MKPIEKINNITVNNTLRKTYKEMIKNKKIVVGLNSYMEKENNKERGPRDSLKFMGALPTPALTPSAAASL